jgi:hypothetical protein
MPCRSPAPGSGRRSLQTQRILDSTYARPTDQHERTDRGADKQAAMPVTFAVPAHAPRPWLTPWKIPPSFLERAHDSRAFHVWE